MTPPDDARGAAAGVGDAGARASESDESAPPNVLLIVMDTARAKDVLERRDVTPNLHRRAAEGTTYTNVFTTAPWTLPSHASMFTGQYTTDHGTHAGARAFEPDVPPLAELLRRRGYQTVSFSNNSWVSPEFGFDRGFETFEAGWAPFESDVDLIDVAKSQNGRLDKVRALGEQLSVRDLPATLGNVLYAKLLRRRVDDGAWLTNHRIERWFDGQRDEDRPFFAFVNYLEPHLEYRPPRGYRSTFLPDGVDYAEASEVEQDAWAYLAGDASMSEREFEILRGLYRAELHYLDSRIDRLFDALRDRGVLENTAVFVVGDHGENVGDHGLMDHQYSLYDTLLRVPVFYLPPSGGSAAGDDRSIAGDGRSTAGSGQTTPPRTDETLRELRDLHPAILDLAGVDPPQSATVSRRSLLEPRGRPYVVGEYVHPQPDPAELRARVDSVETDLSRFDRGLRSIRTQNWKLVEGTDGSETLYCVPEPGEEIPASEISPARPPSASPFENVLFGEASGESPPGHDASGDGALVDGGSDTSAPADGVLVEGAPRNGLDTIRKRLRDQLHEDRGEMATPDAEDASDADVDESTQRRLEDLGYI